MGDLYLTSPNFTLDVRLKEPPPETIPDYRSSCTDDANRISEIGPSFKPISHFQRSPPTSQPPSTTYADPTPIALAGFLLSNMPSTIMLLGLGGAGGGTGNETTAVGPFLFLGSALLYFSGLAEWLRHQTFAATIYFTLAGYFGAQAASLIPGFGIGSGAGGSYGNSWGVFLVFMGIMMAVFALGSLRIDVVHVYIFVVFTICFGCEAASYFTAETARDGPGYRWRVAAGWTSLAGSAGVWYLFMASILDSVDFPFTLPVGDLSEY
ncbi:hypothetical protein LTR95_007392, partial [Oleoguttula sp. CCFEE 5521]